MPSVRREVVEQLVQAKLSTTRACQIAGLSRAAYYKKPMPALNAIVTQHGRWDFGRVSPGCGSTVAAGTKSAFIGCTATWV